MEAGEFDAVYCERVFLHLRNPEAVMAELFRVLRPGGRALVIDPDHSCAAYDADDLELADMLTAQVLNDVVNPRSGRRLRSQMMQAGFVEVTVEARYSPVSDAQLIRTIEPRTLTDRLDELVAARVISRDRADAYLDDQARREAEGRLLNARPIYTVLGIKPPTE